VLLLGVALGLIACADGDEGGGDSTPDTTPTSTVWLHTEGARIVTADGKAWMGRGVNIHDTRSCNACTWGQPDVAEVERRIDEAVSWGANFLRLDLESYGSRDGRVHWQGILDDAGYREDVLEIVRHIGTKPGVYVLVSLWADPSLDGRGWPTERTARVWERLTEMLHEEGHVLFGVANEPKSNWDGSLDAGAWQAMNRVVAAIRETEERLGSPRHIVAVQGTRQWARVLDYYVTHPIEAGWGRDVVYETHVYDPASTFEDRFLRPARSIPVVIGEFGPVSTVANMSADDCRRLMNEADAAGVPYLAWTFHMRCGPNLLRDLSGRGCGVGMPLEPTEWGELLRAHLSGL
jgi:endoglucanase